MTRHAIVPAGLIVAALTFLPSPGFGQNASCSLSGTVYDASNAVVPNAKVVLTDEATKTIRETVSNGNGFFSMSAIQPGSYTAAVSAPGFAAWERAHIVFNQGENRNLPNVVLQIKTAAERVQVSASLDSAAPLDTGETRQTLTSQMLEELPIEGRNASELIKIMPGMAMNNGLSQYGWNSLITKSNVGPVGQYVANGTQPNGAMTVTSDGANLLDPGNQGTQVANINPNQIAELTLLTSAYGAEYAKGPVTFQAIGKSGAAAFHGSIYLYATDFNLDSEDSYYKSLGYAKSKANPSFAFPGGEIGGPVLIPGTRFNRKRQKLFFYAAPEGMVQPTSIETVTFVPTAQMLQGNFSPQYLASLGTGFLNAYSNYAAPPNQHGADSAYPGGMIPQSQISQTSVAYAATFPAASFPQPNATGNNFYDGLSARANRFEFRVRTDYDINDTNRLSVTWVRQDESDQNPIGIWWWPYSALPYPSQMPAHLVSNIVSGNFVHIFSPTLTNETVFAAAQFVNPVQLSDPAAVDPAALGLGGYQPLVPDKYVPQPPNVAGVPGYYAPAFGTSFYGGDFGKWSFDPSFADNLSKVIRGHALKFGVYWDFAQNDQPGGLGDFPQGLVVFSNIGANSSGNTMADFVTGRVQSFQQVPGLNVYALKQSQYSLYAQDQWKIARRLILTYGVRADHIGEWYPLSGPGLAVWNPAAYNNAGSAGAWTGLLWHGIDKSVPVSGFPSQPFFPLPRFGMAWDISGHGKTVLRGGFGVYRYQFSYNSVTIAGTYDEPTGIPSYTMTNPANFGWNFAQYGLPNTAAGLGGNIAGLQQGDGRTPYTEDYNLTVSQALPWKSILEVEYSGSRSRDLLLTGNGSNSAYLGNMNKTPLGAYFRPDPITGVINDPASVAIPYQDYRPYQNYQTMMLVSHGSYQNYNALMASWNKKTGPVTLMVNYTFGKVLGIRDGETDNGAGNGYSADPFNLRDNYGVLPYDHTSIFNAAYVIRVPFQIHGGNLLLRAVANGWVLAGTTMWQSGAPMQPNTGGNMNLNTTGALNSQMWLGTDSEEILPILTCDPHRNLQPGQYFNPTCFALGPHGTNGPTVWPYIKGPAYFKSDLSLHKGFRVRERTIEFRVAAFNFLNHPLPQFTWPDDELQFAAPVAGTRNSNALDTGYPIYKVGSRVVSIAFTHNF
ncbi:MAG: carboxypeptidase regulatory-like domain-containing protein [Bryobacteraceae bacterium]